jgi:hypothetical protein
VRGKLNGDVFLHYAPTLAAPLRSVPQATLIDTGGSLTTEAVESAAGPRDTNDTKSMMGNILVIQCQRIVVQLSYDYSL